MFNIYIHNHFLKTPHGNPFQVPTLDLVRAIEDEWERDPSPQYQNKIITSLAATALDRVPNSRNAYTKMIINSVVWDAILFWETSPQSIVKLQEKHWHPILLTINERFDLTLKPNSSFKIAPLSEIDQNSIHSFLEQLSDFKLLGFSHLVTLTESFCLSYLVQQGELLADKAWDLAHLHKHSQRKIWGDDKEELALEMFQRSEFHETIRFLNLIQ